MLAEQPPHDPVCPFDQATRQEDHHEHEHDPEGQVPALADEEMQHADHDVFQPVGKEGKPAMQDVVVDLREDVLEIIDETRA